MAHHACYCSAWPLIVLCTYHMVMLCRKQHCMCAPLCVQMERIEARDMNSEELLARVKMCEDALAVINHEKLSPFHQVSKTG